jgi:hypothetical protein
MTVAGIIWFALSQRKGQTVAKGAAALAVGGLICAVAVGCSRPAHHALGSTVAHHTDSNATTHRACKGYGDDWLTAGLT